MREFIKLLSIVFGMAAVTAFVACERDTPAEEAAEDAGERIEEVGDEVEDATD